MEQSFRAQLLDQLEHGWGTYVTRFSQLTPADQTAFLQKQGYARLADLLAHVIAWWERALLKVPRRLADPQLPQEEIDVDAFNGAAVARFRDWEESAVIARFDARRRAWIDLVQSLPTEALADERIHWQLNIEIIGHLEEHAIP